MITLTQFPSAKEILNLSPFCLKAETYLRLNEIPYRVRNSVAVGKAPKRKFPVIEDEGHVVADSSFIIDYLKSKHGEGIDAGLSAEEKAHSYAYQHMLEDRAVPALVYYRWQMDHGWDVFSRAMFAGAPAPVRMIFGGIIRRRAVKTLQFRGMGRHTPDEVMVILRKALQSLSSFLGQKDFYFGSKPTSLDVVSFAVVFNIFAKLNPPELQALAKEYPNLSAHVARMRQLFEAKAGVCQK